MANKKSKRLEIKPNKVGTQIKVNPTETIIVDEYMTDVEYDYIVLYYSQLLQKKSVKKNDIHIKK